MKTFLTICTCAMVTAGIYGFADMAVDVKNGKMIQYDRGDEGEEEMVEGSVAIAAAVAFDNQALRGKKMLMAGHEKAKQQVEAKQVFKKSQEKKIMKVPVVTEPVITDEIVVEELTTDVKVDSVPQIEIKEEREFDYREFSRGAPRKHKKKK